MKKDIFFLVLLICLGDQPGFGWGFWAHGRINRLAVFSLPPEMIKFYKRHIGYLEENAVNPDRRRYAVEGEAPRHYIDLEEYGGDTALKSIPRFWKQAVEKYSEDSLEAYGLVPWHINFIKGQLTEALSSGMQTAFSGFRRIWGTTSPMRMCPCILPTTTMDN